LKRAAQGFYDLFEGEREREVVPCCSCSCV